MEENKCICNHNFSDWNYSYSHPLYNTICLSQNKPASNMGHYERTCKNCGLVQTIYEMTPKEYFETKKGQIRILKNN